MMKERKAKEETLEKQEPEETISDVHMSDPSSSNMAMRGTTKRHDDEQGREEVNRSKTSSDDSNSVRRIVSTRNDDESEEETKEQKIKCLNPCNVDDRDMEDKHVENDPTFVVTSNPHPRETRQAVKVGGIATNFAAVWSTLVAKNIVKKISTEDAFLCVVVEPEIARQDIEAALNEGMKTQVIIDDMQLFVCEVIEKKVEENMTDINERADKCHEPETHDEFAWNDVNNCKAGPSTSSRSTKDRHGVLPEEARVQKSNQGRCR